MSTNRRREITATLLFTAAILLAGSLLTYDPEDPSFFSIRSDSVIHNGAGRFGAYLSDLFLTLFGLPSYLFPVAFGVAGAARLRKGEGDGLSPGRLAGFVLLISSTCAFAGLYLSPGPQPPGGLLGIYLDNAIIGFFGGFGSNIVFLSLFFIGILSLTSTPLPKIGAGVLTGVSAAWTRCGALFTAIGWRAGAKERLRESREGYGHARPRVSHRPPEPLPEPKEKKKEPEPLQEPLDYSGQTGYRLPPLSLLSDPPPQRASDQEALERNGAVLAKKLEDFGVEGQIVQHHPGPVVTLYEFEPAAGIKVNQITNLSEDLAMAMKALRVRIIAPLPEKSSVGIEVPNPARQEVFLKEVLKSEEFTDNPSRLKLAFGKDIFGKPYVADLAEMPHLLVAGATQSGKSVSLNAMILSLLYSTSPEELRLLLIDPKRLEFSLYADIPHLREPVVTGAKEASRALRRLLVEMQRRYEILAEAGVRDIEAYNTAHPEERLPYLVVMIDELADLMMVSARDVEDSIIRLAQMARAAGIHMILATQRPSVDVLTGLIKANFPARIAFRVAARVDSRTILDANGAEELLGRGDMLFLPPSTGVLTRIHGSKVSASDVSSVVGFVKGQGPPRYEEEEKGTPLEEGEEVRDDPIYPKAVDLVLTSGQASASLIQRRLQVGYPRAARMIEKMERERLVGPAIGSKPRQILVRRDGEERR